MVINRRALALTLLFLSLSSSIKGETNLSVSLGLQNLVVYDANLPAQDAWTLFPTADGQIIFASSANSQVKGEVRLKALAGMGQETWDLSRAWIRFRIPDPSLIFNLGKTRLLWGEGLVFNTGDMIHGSMDRGVNLGAEELRAEANWLGGIKWSFGPFSFLEGVLRLDEAQANAEGDAPPILFPSIHSLSSGARIRFPLGSLSTEASYFWSKGIHSASLTAQFALGINWFFSSRINIPHPGFQGTEQEELFFSAGLYDVFPLGSDNRLSTRLETLFLPAQSPSWYLFPEISFSWDQIHSLSLRALGAVQEPSAHWALSYTWSALQGLKVLFTLSGNAGGENTSFGWGNTPENPVPGLPTPDLVFSLGSRFVY